MKKENKAKKMEEKKRLGVHMKVAHVTVIVIIFLANDILFLIFFFNATIFFWIWSFRSSHKRRSFKMICKHLILRYWERVVSWPKFS